MLRFRPGRVLDAIAHDRWIVIDEANRADMDRIFGGLLTWLSRQQVVVGRASTRVGSPLVRLGWTDQPSSYAERVRALSDEDPGSDPVDYWAGTEFRLLGTYNALDAQRVFRFGVALGRRFAQVPIPPAGVEDFQTMLAVTAAEIPDALRPAVVDKIVALYRAHHSTVGAQVGPGLLLSIPEYVAKGLRFADLVAIQTDDEQQVDALVVEAYLLAVGSWLARLDEHSELRALADRLTSRDATAEATRPALTPEEWDWVASQLSLIGG